MVAPPRELHLWKVLLCFLLRPSCCLEAYVAPSFSAAVGGPFSGAPAILSFTTSAEDFYRRFHVELRVVFLPEDQPISSIAQADLSPRSLDLQTSQERGVGPQEK
ncbi:unnamed protein product [Durusdinium trenchii]|uniref:Uncharacterized protein n=1 Tax=Durusdinium trenchii TaxID=1381693 RepID=A0ABP0HP26_9DINO